MEEPVEEVREEVEEVKPSLEQQIEKDKRNCGITQRSKKRSAC